MQTQPTYFPSHFPLDMKRILFTCVVAGLSCSAMAEMPNYNVKAHCSEVANFGGAPSQLILSGCYQQEQSSYDALKGAWEKLPAATRKHCDSVARFGSGAGSYLILKGCVDQELSASKVNDNFVFKR